MDEMMIKRVAIGVAVILLLGSIVTQNGTVFGGMIMLLVLLSPFGVAWYINSTADIRHLREKIKAFRPGQWTMKDVGDGFIRPDRIRLGVIGVQASGKSAFLNSIFFAFKGVWEHVYTEKVGGSSIGGGETIFRDPVKLNDYITTLDTRGLRDLSDLRVPDVMAEICGERGINTRWYARGEKIDCPIFVYKYSALTGTRNCKEFLRSFLPQIRETLGSYPIMVVTFADDIANRDVVLNDIVSEGMEKSSVFFIENYTEDKHEMDSKKHVALLKVLVACIKRGDDNVTFKWRIEHEKSEMSKCEIM